MVRAAIFIVVIVLALGVGARAEQILFGLPAPQAGLLIPQTERTADRAAAGQRKTTTKEAPPRQGNQGPRTMPAVPIGKVEVVPLPPPGQQPDDEKKNALAGSTLDYFTPNGWEKISVYCASHPEGEPNKWLDGRFICDVHIADVVIAVFSGGLVIAAVALFYVRSRRARRMREMECVAAVELPWEDDVAERGKTKSVEQSAKERGLTVDELLEFTSSLFGDQPEEAACVRPDEAGRDPPPGKHAFGPSVSRAPSNSEIAALPECTASIVRELVVGQAAKLTEISGRIAELMGHENLASIDAETRTAIERTAQEIVQHWEQQVGLAKPSSPLITSNLQQLVHEHYQLGENIHAYLKEAPHDDLRKDDSAA